MCIGTVLLIHQNKDKIKSNYVMQYIFGKKILSQFASCVFQNQYFVTQNKAKPSLPLVFCMEKPMLPQVQKVQQGSCVDDFLENDR